MTQPAITPTRRFPRFLAESAPDAIVVNDVHSNLNRTRVDGIVCPESIEAVQALVRSARRDGTALSVAGGRHAMGGQQFATSSTLIDMNGLTRVIEFDRIRGEIEVEAGIQWPELYQFLIASQANENKPWAFVQKQTGADKLSIGGALASNVHGRGLRLQPFIGDVIAFTIVGPDGVVRRCTRTENPEVFDAAIGGYGLFGAIVNVRLRLTPRHKVQRIVEVVDIDDLPAMFDRRIAAGYQYGDFQFATELDPDALLRKGVFSCYRPVEDATPMPSSRAHLTPENWRELILLAHVDRARAFEAYSNYYLTTSGQYYWSDEHQMSTYIPDYHDALGVRLGEYAHGTEMISEIYVPRDALVRFLADVRSDFLEHRTDMIYGTIRLIERDTETLLRWAKEPYACIIFNIHVMPDPAGIERAKQEFRRLIDRGLQYGGSYYLTYHRWAERRQVLAAYPEFPEFLRLKRRLDPSEVFQSDWYRHYKAMFADKL
ncbi:MAG: L-gulono,4-lactone dehydrogenase [Gemmatimonadales bacterium]|nr:L-gulono,4-lactone dehydrogenase [Gemmatimonadales bacterium]